MTHVLISLIWSVLDAVSLFISLGKCPCCYFCRAFFYCKACHDDITDPKRIKKCGCKRCEYIPDPASAATVWSGRSFFHFMKFSALPPATLSDHHQHQPSKSVAVSVLCIPLIVLCFCSVTAELILFTAGGQRNRNTWPIVFEVLCLYICSPVANLHMQWASNSNSKNRVWRLN